MVKVKEMEHKYPGYWTLEEICKDLGRAPVRTQKDLRGEWRLPVEPRSGGQPCLVKDEAYQRWKMVREETKAIKHVMRRYYFGLVYQEILRREGDLGRSALIVGCKEYYFKKALLSPLEIEHEYYFLEKHIARHKGIFEEVKEVVGELADGVKFWEVAKEYWHLSSRVATMKEPGTQKQEIIHVGEWHLQKGFRDAQSLYRCPGCGGGHVKSLAWSEEDPVLPGMKEGKKLWRVGKLQRVSKLDWDASDVGLSVAVATVKVFLPGRRDYLRCEDCGCVIQV